MNITFIFSAILFVYSNFDFFEQPIQKYSDSESLSCQEQPQHISSARRYVDFLVWCTICSVVGYTFYAKGKRLLNIFPKRVKLNLMFSELCTLKPGFTSRNASCKSDKDRYDLQKEILETLFTVPERFEEAREKTSPVRRTVGRSRRYGQVVAGPLRDTTTEPKTAVAKLLVKENGKLLYVYLNTIQEDAFFHDVNCIEVAENVEFMIIVCLLFAFLNIFKPSYIWL